MAGKFDEADKIIEATDIVALVSKYVKLEKQGKNYKGLCPFHNEDTPSFVVSPEKRMAHCFGCGGGGNPVNFLMQIENIEFVDALERLAEFNGMEFHRNVKKTQASNSNQKYYKIMSVAQAFYKKFLDSSTDGVQAKEYLRSRGMDTEIMEAFGVGLSPKVGNTLYQVLKDSDFLELDMCDMSLVEKNATGYYDLFSNRIMFPICDAEGRPIAFSARIFNSKDKNQPKYINSRETNIFHKNETLFNLHLAKSDMLKKKRVILHEGQMDVIASYRSGLKEAICTLGTALSDFHAKLLAKYTNSVVICYDGDKAGINASRKAIKIFKANNFLIRLVLLPDGMDPDEYVLKYGEAAYHEYFESNQMDANQYLFETAFIHKNLQDSNIRESIKDEIFQLILEMPSATEREDYLKKLASMYQVSIEAIGSDFDRFRSTHAAPTSYIEYPQEVYYPEDMNYGYEEPAVVVTPPKRVNRNWNSLCELRLFMYAKASREQAYRIDAELNEYMNALSPDSQRLWIKLMNDFYENFQVFEEGTFIKMLGEEDVKYYLEILEELRKDKTTYSDEDLRKCLEKLKVVQCDVSNRMLASKISATDDITLQSRLLDEKLKNKRKKEQLLKKKI